MPLRLALSAPRRPPESAYKSATGALNPRSSACVWVRATRQCRMHLATNTRIYRRCWDNARRDRTALLGSHRIPAWKALSFRHCCRVNDSRCDDISLSRDTRLGGRIDADRERSGEEQAIHFRIWREDRGDNVGLNRINGNNIERIFRDLN